MLWRCTCNVTFPVHNHVGGRVCTLGVNGGQGYAQFMANGRFLFGKLPMVLAGTVLALSFPAAAQDTDDVPYWASLTADKANMRVGPGGSYRIIWVYQRQGLPLKVVRRLSGWRQVEDPDGARGWVVSRFLSRERAAIVTGEEKAMMRATPSDDSKLLWQLEPGVTGWLGDCADGWCRFAVGERGDALKEGWVRQSRLWGPGEP